MTRIAILVRFTETHRERSSPLQAPLGWAARAMHRSGVDVLFTNPELVIIRQGRFLAAGWRPQRDGWQQVEPVVIDAIYNRYAANLLREEYANLRHQLAVAGIPVGNPLAAVRLCRDKLASQQVLENNGFSVPAVETRKDHRIRTLERWGTGFWKPQFGSCGRDILHIRSAVNGWLVDGADRECGLLSRNQLEEIFVRDETIEPFILQQAVPPLLHGGSVNIRSLIQQCPDGSWTPTEWVIRYSHNDSVCNVDRGADITDFSGLASLPIPRGRRRRMMEQMEEYDQQLGPLLMKHLEEKGAYLLEVGIDYLPDPDGRVYILELNDTPRGRLWWLAQVNSPLQRQYRRVWHAALLRPLQVLAERIAKTRYPNLLPLTFPDFGKTPGCR